VAKEFRLPDIGEGLTEAEIVRWLVEVGDTVTADQPIVEVETDKAVVEIPTPFAGTVVQLGGSAGEVVEVGNMLVVIGQPDDDAVPDSVEHERQSDPRPQVESEPTARAAEPTQFAPAASAAAAPIVGSLSEDAEILRPRVEPAEPTGPSVKALPVVRKLARDNGVDLARLAGTGPEGRITREDVQGVIDSQVSTPSAAEESPPLESHLQPTSGKDETTKMSRLRRTIADNMSKSWAEIPHVTTFDDVDATRLLETRSALAARHATKLPLEALVVKAVLPALDEFPMFNSSLSGENLILHAARDIGIAVDTSEGLMVAVIRDAADKSVLELAAEIVRLGEGARERTLGIEELTGQTFTVSNIGAVGGGHGTPIVPYGTTAILSVGRAKDRAIVEDGDLLIAPVMPLSLSYDHRVIDGATGRRFMAMVMENLEEPALFLAG
jgi:pyruvate/2-oxoglutarate dehydrogenase complex dihydrolipoamide acyltransferase (E2) component